MIEQEKKEQIIFALLYTFLKNSKQKKKTSNQYPEQYPERYPVFSTIIQLLYHNVDRTEMLTI